MTPAALGRLLRDAREKLGLSQAALAKKAHVSASIIGKVERETENAPLRELLQVADALGLDLDLLVLNPAAPSCVRAVPDATWSGGVRFDLFFSARHAERGDTTDIRSMSRDAAEDVRRDLAAALAQTSKGTSR